MSHIFFTVKRDVAPGREPETFVVASITDDAGVTLAEHRMTILGAIVRSHDLEAAITDARKAATRRPGQFRRPEVRP